MHLANGIFLPEEATVCFVDNCFVVDFPNKYGLVIKSVEGGAFGAFITFEKTVIDRLEQYPTLNPALSFLSIEELNDALHRVSRFEVTA